MERLEKHDLLEQLFYRYYSDLVGYIRTKYRRQSVSAEDIAQDTFVRLQRLQDIDAIQNHKAHLYKTASNLAIDCLRREKLKVNYLNKQSHTSVSEEYEDTPQRLLALEDQLSELDKSLSVLPENCRKTLLMHRIHGLSYGEIATELSVSVSSVEKYMLRALQHCRNILVEEEN